jgi:hypothetical protein
LDRGERGQRRRLQDAARTRRDSELPADPDANTRGLPLRAVDDRERIEAGDPRAEEFSSGA